MQLMEFFFALNEFYLCNLWNFYFALKVLFVYVNLCCVLMDN